MELFYALEVGLERVGLAFALMLLPPWAVVPLTAISNSDKYAVPVGAGLGALGALFAHTLSPGAYLGEGWLADLGVTGSAAALLSGLFYGGAVGLTLSGIVRALRFGAGRPRPLE
jgi:hypothetical protein